MALSRCLGVRAPAGASRALYGARAFRAASRASAAAPALARLEVLPAQRWSPYHAVPIARPKWSEARRAFAAGALVDQVCPSLGGESITEGTLMEWRKDVGDIVTKGEIIAAIETDKVTIDVPAAENGVLREIIAKADDTVEVGGLLARIEPGGEASVKPAGAPQPAEAKAPSTAAAPAPVAAAAPSEHAPLTGLRATFARLAAQRLGLPDPTAPAPASPAAKAPPAKAAPMAVPVTGSEGRTERRVPMSSVRRRVTQRLKDAQNTAALLTTFQEADMSAALEIRSKYKDVFQKKYGAPLGYLSLFAKASAAALMEEPAVNAIIDDGSTEVVYRDYVDLSVPIPSPRGPVHCVLRNVESKSVSDLECEIAGLMTKARKDELSVEDMGPPTFGIIDSGATGGMMGTLMINPPQSAVLGTNSVTRRPMAVDGKVVAKPMMFLSLTYDHRLIDGREAVTFLCSVRDKMEDPNRMLIGL